MLLIISQIIVCSQYFTLSISSADIPRSPFNDANICYLCLQFAHSVLYGGERHHSTRRFLRACRNVLSQGPVLIHVQWSLFGQKHVDFTPVSGCHIGLDRDTYVSSSVKSFIGWFGLSSAIRKQLWLLPFGQRSMILPTGIASAWEALFIYDTIIFSFTLFKTYKERRNHITPDILSLILRDGEQFPAGS